MREYDLIVHIGQGKTGTSSIQYTLKNNLELLENKGYKLLDRVLHDHQGAKIGLDLFNDEDLIKNKDSKLYKTLYEVCNNCKDYSVIWSNESIFDSTLIIPVLKSLSINFKILVVLYIRRPDRWTKSAYTQWGIKHKAYRGLVRNFKEWTGELKFLNTYGNVELWNNAFQDDLIIKNFDEIDNVVIDFLNLLALDGLNIIRINDSPTTETLYSWIIFNSMDENPKHPNDFERVLKRLKVDNINSQDINQKDMKGFFPTNDDINEVLSKSVETINMLNNLLKQKGQPVFDSFEDEKLRKSYDQEVLIKMLIQMIFTLEKRVHKLEHEQLLTRRGG